MLPDPSDRWKDLLIERRPPRWPKVILILMILGGLATWFYLHPEQIPDLSTLKSLTEKTLNAPVVVAPAPVTRTAEPEEDLLAADPQPSRLKK